ncbi:MAG: FtsX-like permease family protein [Pseudophaeobacter sp. bin_em_oilr2.035]|uniref:FtsX-like permease family protein n=1 Tax=Phaeobacter gallaeciensis TaxID=60890 RepID=A0ABD4X808_9RHOB|nr:FtsX-like permease family protein [Phaeobacter gallaeciensis]MDF1773060.1 FtsX-like permease family protein [Pseudophaeobacter sp. bin_em_oilr2.035]MDE4144015.1 FtsX-like permease family protein [Phaeobacter gallaeciensis]MDE4157104.1 FtsX-like permease family protein [Phaeobacter gallaeciensis]MDE4161290.1 FtsX-like permease family protein [Phaeobacter gallaeciensis]MDE4165511.1 FtsX-like permease family protein [Phaeobacter gallaeciensis]
MSFPDLRLAWRFALRELRSGLKGFRIFLACLALGVGVIAAIGSIRASIEAGLTREGATMLGGDAEMSFTYRFANEEERDWMASIAERSSEIADFRSMAVVGEERALTQVKAVDGLYPLTGTLRLSPDIPLEDALAGSNGVPGGLMERVLADRLGLAPGDVFRLGTQDLRLAAIIENEPDAAASGFTLGPRTIVATDALAQSGLLEPGTLYSSKYRLDLPPGANLEQLQAAAEERFANSGMRWRDARNGAPGITSFVERLGGFLVLVGLSGLAVGGVGVSAAVRAFLAGKTETIATLRTLGAGRQVIFLTYFLQIGVLALLGIAMGMAIGGLGPVLVGPLIAAQLPFPAVFSVYPGALAEAALYGLLTAFIFALWPLARAERIRAAALFRDAFAGGSSLPAPRYVLATALALALLVAAAALFSGSVRLTLWTAGGLGGALAVLMVAALILGGLARRAARIARGRPALRWALAAIGTSRDGAVPAVLALGLGLTVLAAIGQIDGNMRRAITGTLPDVAPSYFFVDIQRDQMPAFLDRVEGDPAVSRIESAPMLRGVVTGINGQPASEVAGDHWVVRGDRGLTYAGAKPENTQVTAGEWWGEDYNGPPQISLAEEEAGELGIAIGDTMTVNVLGRDITATVTSFRSVDFSTAGMGFVIAMNESALAAAPHSYIATVYAEEQAEAQILRDLAQEMPNITAIRVRDAVDRVSDILRQLAAATSYGAAATLLTGFLVLLGTAAAGEPARRYEAALLKTLGAPRAQILKSFALRSIILGAGAGMVALAAGIAGAWAVNSYVFETSYSIIWPNALAVVGGGVLTTLLAGLAFALRPLAARPARILRARD